MSFQDDHFDEASRNYDQVRYQAVERFLRPSEDASVEIVKRSKRPTRLRHFLDEISKAGMQYALANDADVNSFEDDLLWPGLSVVTDLHSCLVKDLWDRDDPTETYDFWHHEKPPLDVSGYGNPPYFERTGIENAATTYLDLPYRAPVVERLLVDVLIAMELYAYGAEMIAPRNLLIGLKWLPSRSPLHERHALWGYIVNMFYAGVVLLLPGTASLYYLPSIVGETAANWIGGILIALFVLVVFLSTVSLPWRWFHQHKMRAKTLDLLQAMCLTYAELESDGALSTQRIREAASKAADLGVVWPGLLFAILDDNIKRTGRL